MSKELENKLQSKIIASVRKYGAYVYKNAQNIYTEKGRPDLTACVPMLLSTLQELFGDVPIGVFVGLEIKRKGHLNEVSEAQEIVGRKIKSASGLWYAVDSVEIVEELLKQLTKNVKD